MQNLQGMDERTMQHFQEMGGTQFGLLTKLETFQKLQNVSICINSLPEISVHFSGWSKAWFKSPKDHNAQKNLKNRQNRQKWIIFWSSSISETKSETQLFADLQKSGSQKDKIPSNHQRTAALCFWFRGSCTHGQMSKKHKKVWDNKRTPVIFSIPSPDTIASLRDN